MSYEEFIAMLEKHADVAERIEGPHDFKVNWPDSEGEPMPAGTYEMWRIGSHDYYVRLNPMRPSLVQQAPRFIVRVFEGGQWCFFTESAECGDLSIDDFADW